MPPPAPLHSETFAGPEPNHSPHEITIAGLANADPLQQFTPETPRVVLKPQAIARQPIADGSGTEGSNPPRVSLSRSWDFRVPAWITAISNVPVPGVNVPLRSFLCGIALGAFAMWLLGVQPALYGRLWQPAASTEGSTSIPAAVAPAASVVIASADPSARDVNLPPESTRVEAGLNDPAATPAAPLIAAAVPPARVPRAVATGSSASRVAPAGQTAPVQIKSAPVAPPAAPVGPVAFRGSLVVRSEPSGARVFVRGQPVGVTPVVLKDVPIGSRAVRIEADGYQAWSAAVQVVANQQTQVTARLDRTNPEPRP